MPTVLREIEVIKAFPKELIVQWKIKEFSSLSKLVYYSSPFSFANKSWCLLIWPNGGFEDGYLSLFLRKKSSGSVELELSFSLKTTDEKKVFEKHQTFHFGEGEDWPNGFSDFLSRSELLKWKSDWLPSDILTVICTLKYPDGASSTAFGAKSAFNTLFGVSTPNTGGLSGAASQPTSSGSFGQPSATFGTPASISTDAFRENYKDETSSEDEVGSDEEDNEKRKVSSKIKGLEILSENFKQMFLDGQMCDAVLKTDGRKFDVHKCVLVARSPVFASMFRHDLAEKNSNEVAIPDCTSESFEAFLYYIYSGSAERLSTNTVYNVYYAADKYQVDDLKEKCVNFMTENISVETFCDVVALSLRHGESKLQKLATDFFGKNIKTIIKTVQWQRYMDENSTQANELLIKALNA